MPAGYMALERIALPTGLVEKGEKFGSDLVPGRAWKPIDKEAKDAVKARDEAAKEAAAVPAEANPLAAVVEALEMECLEKDEVIAALQAQVAKFDGDKDGKVGGSAAK